MVYLLPRLNISLLLFQIVVFTFCMFIQYTYIEMSTFDFFHFVSSSFVNDPFRSCFSIVLKRNLFRSFSKLSLIFHFVCFITKRFFIKIVRSVKSFFQRLVYSRKLFVHLKNNYFFKKCVRKIVFFSKKLSF